MPPLDENFTASLERKSVSATGSDGAPLTCSTCKLEFAGNEAYQFFIHRSLCGQSPDGGMSNLREKLTASLNNNLNTLNHPHHLNNSSNHQLNNHMNSNRSQSPAEPCSPKQRNSNSFLNQIGLNSELSQLSKAVGGLFQQQSTSQQLQNFAHQLTGGQSTLTNLLNGDSELNLIDKLPSADFNAMLSLLQQQNTRLPSAKSANSLSSPNNAFQSKPNLSTNQQSSSLQKSFNRSMPGMCFVGY